VTTTSTVTTLSPGATSVPGTTRSARGPIAAFDAQAITVGDVTCPLGSFVYGSLSQNLRVGDVVSLSCTLREGGPTTMTVMWSRIAPATSG
jgi:hypothetical protein